MRAGSRVVREGSLAPATPSSITERASGCCLSLLMRGGHSSLQLLKPPWAELKLALGLEHRVGVLEHGEVVVPADALVDGAPRSARSSSAVVSESRPRLPAELLTV